MTEQTILAVLDSPESAAACLRAAADAAAALPQSRIEVLHVRMDPASAIELPEVVTKRYAEAIERRSDTEGAALRAAFDAWQASNPPTAAIWVEVQAVPAEAIRERGALAALVVIGRPTESTHPAAATGFDAALFATEKPVMVMPPGAGSPFGRHLAVGWRNVPTTCASLAALRPWLMAATTVSLITVTDWEAAVPADWAAENLPQGAALHIVRSAGRTDGAALLAEAAALGADGLAMGAYSHGRLMERLFGGVTAEVLRDATIPVLMRA